MTRWSKVFDRLMEVISAILLVALLVTVTLGIVTRALGEPLIWTEAERARGQAWGVKTVESFHYYGTPPTAEDRGYALAAGVAAP